VRALISTYDKTGLDVFALGLAELGWELVASGGTAAYLEELGLTVERNLRPLLELSPRGVEHPAPVVLHERAQFPIPALSFLLLGTLVAADWPLPPRAVTALAMGLGLVHGCLNGVAMQQAGTGVLGLLGIMAALFVLVTLVAACVVALQRPWTRIVVRVAGSWIAAMGLLMLGWSLRGHYGRW